MPKQTMPERSTAKTSLSAESESKNVQSSSLLLQGTVQRAMSGRSALQPSEIMTLQRSIGNRAVGRLLSATISSTTTQSTPHAIQRKVEVGAADDQYERDASHVAETVTQQGSSSAPKSVQRAPAITVTQQTTSEASVQRLPKFIKKMFGLGKYKKNKQTGGTTGTKTKTKKIDDNIDDYVTAYRKARLFHGTGTGFVDSIEESGLQTKYGGTGANGAPNRKNRVFLGWDSVTSEGYGKGKGLGRVFLPPERTVAEMNSNDYNDGTTPVPEDRKREMFRDPENPSAYFTERDIPSGNVFFGTNEELLDNPKSQGILQTISQHMQNPPGSMEELVQLHTRAMRERRISIRAGDENTSSHIKNIRK